MREVAIFAATTSQTSKGQLLEIFIINSVHYPINVSIDGDFSVAAIDRVILNLHKIESRRFLTFREYIDKGFNSN